MPEFPIESAEAVPVEWCVMFYMVGDNNLGDEMIRTLSQVYGTDNADYALYAQFDGPHPMVKSVRMNIQKKRAGQDDNSTFLKRIENENSASPESIYDFVVACVAGDGNDTFPGTRARNYALVLSGHGDGIQQRTLMLDESPENSISISQVKGLLGKLVTDLGVRINVLGFDSCLMNTLEVSYELAENCDYLVASQGNIINAGWDIAAICTDLNENGSGWGRVELAKGLADNLKRSNKPYVENANRTADLSVCDLSKLRTTGGPALMTSLKALCDALIPHFPKIEKDEEALASRMVGDKAFGDNDILKKILRDAIQIAHGTCQRFLSEQSIDLYDFCYIMKQELTISRSILKWAGAGSPVSKNVWDALRQVEAKCDSIMQAIKGEGAFVKYGIASGPDAQFANGVSLFFPWSLMPLSLVEKRYDELDFSRSEAGKSWKTFFQGFLDQTHRDRKRPRFVAPPFYKNAPPFYRGSLIYYDYFRSQGNFAIDHIESVTSEPYPGSDPENENALVGTA